MAVDAVRDRGCTALARDGRGQLIQTRRHIYATGQTVVVDLVRQPRDSTRVAHATDYLFIEKWLKGGWRPSHFILPIRTSQETLRPIREFRSDAEVPSLPIGVPYQFTAPDVSARTRFRVCMLLGPPGRATSATSSEFEVLTPGEFERLAGEPPRPIENTGPLS